MKRETCNVTIPDQLLEEICGNKNDNEDETTLIQILKKLTEKDDGKKNLKRLAEKFIIEPYTGKNPNAGQWINSFEEECERFDVEEDRNKIEMLRYFLDKTCLD